MIIKEKIGNIIDLKVDDLMIDNVSLHWHETNKRIQTKTSTEGVEITLRFLKENQHLTDGDVIYKDNFKMVVIKILPCECILITPVNMNEAAAIAYEIGNKHLPLFYEENKLLTPYDAPLFKLLQTLGYKVEKAESKLLHPLRTSVTPHLEQGNSLLSKLLKITTSNE